MPGDREAPRAFSDRAEAGRRLAQVLSTVGEDRPVVLGLPRGGVPVADQVARALQAPLDVILVRKLGVPWQPELAVGAIGEGGVRVVNEDVRRMAAVHAPHLASIEARERAALDRMAQTFRPGHAPVPLRGRVVIVVDDGIATGATAEAACQVARAQGASRVVLAAPVVSLAAIERLRAVADDVVCVATPEPFLAIGQWYRDFTQTSDAEVVALLREDAGGNARAPTGVGGQDEHRDVQKRKERAMTSTSELLVDGFGRVRESVHAVLERLSDDALVFRPDPAANPIGWLVWHLTRVQDDHVAEVAGTEQRWTAEGWDARFALPFDRSETGYGQGTDDVGALDPDPALLLGYHDAVHAATVAYLHGLGDADLDRVVDTRWDPHVTLGVRLLSVLGDDLQHVGQAAYVRGLHERCGR